MNQAELRSHVNTIVVVMMENRSFDHVLGHLRHPEFGNRSDVDGIEDLANEKYLNPNSDGVGVAPFWMPDAPLPSDLPHDPAAVQTQLAFAPVANSFFMTGFVEAFEAEFHTQIPDPPVMGLLRPQDLPATGALAAHYTVCDRWSRGQPTPPFAISPASRTRPLHRLPGIPAPCTRPSTERRGLSWPATGQRRWPSTRPSRLMRAADRGRPVNADTARRSASPRTRRSRRCPRR